MLIDPTSEKVMEDPLRGEVLRLMQEGEFKKALEVAMKNLGTKPTNPTFHYDIANCYAYLSNAKMAIKHYDKALGLAPKFTAARYNLALIHKDCGNLLKAANLLQKVLDRSPHDPDALSSMASVLIQKGEEALKDAYFMQAINYVYKSIEKNPRHFNSWLTMGKIRFIFKDYAKAVWCFNNASEIDPDHKEVYNRLGTALQADMQFGKAEAAYKFAIENNPGWVTPINNMASCLFYQGFHDQSFKCSEAIIAQQKMVDRELIETHSSYLISRLAVDNDWEVSCDRFKEWGKRYADPLYPKTPPTLKPTKDRKIRVGYYSPDFSLHSAAMSFSCLFEQYDIEKFEVYAYNAGEAYDHFTKSFDDASTKFHNVQTLSAEALAALMLEDDLDILVDLSGHTTNNRLIAFAYKPAPVQITGLGFGRTTGMKAMDYMFTDKYIFPPEAQQYIPEGALYIDNLINWKPPPYDLDMHSAYERNGFVTYGCFNSLFKVTQEMLEVWAEILKRDPDAEILFKTKIFKDNDVKERLFKRFEALDIKRSRVKMIGSTSHKDHLNHYNMVDLSLDPFPYQGGITTIESLFMGKPVIARTDSITRSSISIIKHVYTDFADAVLAANREEYIEKALTNAEAVKTGKHMDLVRDMLLKSKICNSDNYAKQIYETYERLVR